MRNGPGESPARFLLAQVAIDPTQSINVIPAERSEGRDDSGVIRSPYFPARPANHLSTSGRRLARTWALKAMALAARTVSARAVAGIWAEAKALSFAIIPASLLFETSLGTYWVRLSATRQESTSARCARVKSKAASGESKATLSITPGRVVTAASLVSVSASERSASLRSSARPRPP